MEFEILKTWPYYVLALAFISLLNITINFKKYNSLQIWALLGLPIYIFHQFEEHGIDIFGNKYSFQKFFCTSLGFDLLECPGDEYFIFTVNVAVWISFLLVSFNNNVWLSVCTYSTMFLNGVFAHLLVGVLLLKYNPGLFTSVVLFIPVSLYGYSMILRRKLLKFTDLVLSLVPGFLVHFIMVFCMVLRSRGMIPYWLFLGVIALEGFLPFYFAANVHHSKILTK